MATTTDDLAVIIQKEFNNINNRFDRLEAKVDVNSKDIKDNTQTIQGVIEEVKANNALLDMVDIRLERIDHHLTHIDHRLNSHNNRITGLELQCA